MTETPKRGQESHPLWQLDKFIKAEQFENHHRLVASDFKDKREADFQDFLQKEVRHRLHQEIASDLIAGYIDKSLSREIITDPKILGEYTLAWKNFFDEARKKTLKKTEVLKKIDSLFEIWNKAPKTTIVFSLN